MLLISGIEANKQQEDGRTDKQLNSIEDKGCFPHDCYDRCDHWKKTFSNRCNQIETTLEVVFSDRCEML